MKIRMGPFVLCQAINEMCRTTIEDWSAHLFISQSLFFLRIEIYAPTTEKKRNSMLNIPTLIIIIFILYLFWLWGACVAPATTMLAGTGATRRNSATRRTDFSRITVSDCGVQCQPTPKRRRYSMSMAHASSGSIAKCKTKTIGTNVRYMGNRACELIM